MQPDTKKLTEVREQGFTIIEGALSAQELQDLRAEIIMLNDRENARLAEIEKTTGKPHPDRNMLFNPILMGPRNAKLLEQPVMHAYLTELMSETCILYANRSSSMPPFGGNSSGRIHVDCPRFIPGYITNIGILYAVSDFTIDNGATYFLPGSQNNDDPIDEEKFYKGAVRAVCKAGDMLLFNARTVHKGGENNTGEIRHSVGFNICRSYMRQSFDFPRLIESTKSDVLSHVGEVGRRMLGYNVRMPASYAEYNLPADQRLYKANQG